MSRDLLNIALDATGDPDNGCRLGKRLADNARNFFRSTGNWPSKQKEQYIGVGDYWMFARAVLGEIRRWAQEESEFGSQKDTMVEPVDGFSRWFNELPESTRKTVEDARLLVVMQNAFARGFNSHRDEGAEGMDLIERNLIETLNVLETLRK